MKAVAYSIKPFEKVFLAKANQKKHDITLISNALNLDTSVYATGKDAVIVFTNDDVSSKVVDRLAGFGIKYIVTRSVGTDHIDKPAAARHKIELANVPSYSPQAIAEHAIALALALNRRLIKAQRNTRNFDFRNDQLIGFNFSGKTAGIVGLGHTGQATAAILNGFGCKVIGFDVSPPADLADVRKVSMNELLATSDIISLHIPLTDQTRHYIGAAQIDQMKKGVMLINTSRGGIVDTEELLSALDTGKIGYLGLDVYEYEKGLFFENHEQDAIRDPLLTNLMQRDNVIVTPHQAYLTNEALQEIADQTIKSLDFWQQNKFVAVA